MTQRPSVAIIGAGIGGTAAALALAIRGFQPVVYERAERAGEVGAGVQLGPNAMRVLEALGISAGIRQVGSAPERVRLRDGLSGRPVASVPMGSVIAKRHGAPYVQMHRADLLGCLLQAARAAGADLRFGASVAPSDLDAEVIIAADGVRSESRKILNSDVDPAFTGQVAWRALIAGGAVSLTPDTHVFMGPGRHLVAYPLRQGEMWNIVAVEERYEWVAEGWNHRDSGDALRSAFAGWSEDVAALLAPVEEPLLWGLFAHEALPRWQDGTLALLGDACHPMLPFMAQGAAMALEDAWVIAECLASEPPSDALRRYEALRKPRATRVQRQSQANARIYHLRAPLLRTGLHLGMRIHNRVLPGALLKRFDWIYGEDVTRTNAR